MEEGNTSLKVVPNKVYKDIVKKDLATLLQKLSTENFQIHFYQNPHFRQQI